MIKKLKDKVLSGGHLSEREAFSLLKTTDKEALYKASGEITKHFCKNKFDMCSIINARSGKCPEDCKWCAQSGHYKTHINTYYLIDREECQKQATLAFQQKIHHGHLPVLTQTIGYVLCLLKSLQFFLVKFLLL